MRTFGGFISNGQLTYGEVCDDAVHVLRKPYWLGIEFTGAILPLGDLRSLCRRASKIIAWVSITQIILGMQRTPLGTPLIGSLRPPLSPHGVTIEIASRSIKPISKWNWASCSGRRRRM